MVLRDIEREDIEFISKTLNCLPISHVDNMRPEKLGTAQLVEEVQVPCLRWILTLSNECLLHLLHRIVAAHRMMHAPAATRYLHALRMMHAPAASMWHSTGVCRHFKLSVHVSRC